MLRGMAVPVASLRGVRCRQAPLPTPKPPVPPAMVRLAHAPAPVGLRHMPRVMLYACCMPHATCCAFSQCCMRWCNMLHAVRCCAVQPNHAFPDKLLEDSLDGSLEDIFEQLHVPARPIYLLSAFRRQVSRRLLHSALPRELP